MANFKLENYAPVNERLGQFYKDNPEGRVTTSIIEHDRESGFVMTKAEIYRKADDAAPAATGHAFEERDQGYVNKTSYVENAETSAVGRALALMGYEIERSIASREEMEKVQRYETAERMPVIRENGHYRVAGFKVTKPDGKIICECKKANCKHIEAVRNFITTIVPVEEMSF